MGEANIKMWHKNEDIDDEGTDRNRQSEKMIKFLSIAKNISAFNGKSVEEVFSNEKSKREFIANLTEEDFINLVRGVNALLRDEQLGSSEMDFQGNMSVGSFLMGVRETFSHQKDKRDIFLQLFRAMQEMNHNERSMEDMALLCGASINAAHGFKNGNGRTSRFLYSLLNNNFDNSLKDELKDILSSEGSDYIDINPEIIGDEIESIIEKDSGIEKYEREGSALYEFYIENQETLKEIVSDSVLKDILKIEADDGRFFLLAIFDLFRETKELQKYIDMNYLTAFNGGMFLGDLSESELNQLMDRYWELKKKKVEMIIDCIAHPEKEEYQKKNNGENIQLIDYFKKEIIESSEDAQARRERWAKKASL